MLLCEDSLRVLTCPSQVLRSLELMRWSGFRFVITRMMEITAEDISCKMGELKEISLSRFSLRDSEREELMKGFEPVIRV